MNIMRTGLLLLAFLALAGCVPRQYAQVKCFDQKKEVEEFWHYSSKLELQLAFVKSGVHRADEKSEEITADVEDLIDQLAAENRMMCEKCVKKQSLPPERCTAETYCHMEVLNWLRVFVNILKGGDRDVVRYASRNLGEISQKLKRCADGHFNAVYIDDANVEDHDLLWKSEKIAAKAFFLQALSRKEKAQQMRERAKETARQAGSRRLTANILFTEAELARKSYKLEKARKHLEEVHDIYQEINARNAQADVLALMGSIYMDDAEFDRAQELLLKAKAIYEKGTENRNVHYADVLCDIGYIQNTRGHPEDAAVLYSAALKIYEEALEPGHPLISKALAGLGMVNVNRDLYKDALEYIEKAVAMDRKIFKKDDPALARSLTNLGTVQEAMGHYEKAIQAYEEALSIYRKNFGEEHQYVSNTLMQIAAIWKVLGYHKRAIDDLEKVLSMERNLVSEDTLETADILNNIASSWYELQKYDRALEYFLEARNIMRRFLEPDDPEMHNQNRWIENCRKMRKLHPF